MILFASIIVLWIVSLSLHEYGHARVAYAGGDHSVAEKGYLSLNPLRYIHPVTSVLIPIIILAVGGVPLPGGAVYIDLSRLRNRHWEAAVSLAGPLATLGCFLLAGLPFLLGLNEPGGQIWITPALFAYFQALCFLLNMLPIPGLDGFGVIAPYLPPELRRQAYAMGNMLILGLVFVMISSPEALRPIYNASWWMIESVGIPSSDLIQGWEVFDNVKHGKF